MTHAQAAPLSKLFDMGLEAQLANIARWNEVFGWNLPGQWFDGANVSPSGLAEYWTVDLLVPILPSAGQGGAKIESTQRTFDGLCRVINPARLRSGVNFPSFDSSSRGLRLLEGVGCEPGIHQVTVDLAAHWEQDPDKYVNLGRVVESDSAGPEGLAAAAHFPEWLSGGMNGGSGREAWERPSGIFLPGYQVRRPGPMPWEYSPWLFHMPDYRETWMLHRSYAAESPWAACPRVLQRS